MQIKHFAHLQKNHSLLRESLPPSRFLLVGDIPPSAIKADTP